MLSFFRTLIAIDLSTLFLIFNYREWLGRVLQVDSTKKISSRRSEAHGGLKLNIQIFYQIQVSTQMNFYKCTWCSMHNYNIFSIKNCTQQGSWVHYPKETTVFIKRTQQWYYFVFWVLTLIRRPPRCMYCFDLTFCTHQISSFSFEACDVIIRGLGWAFH